MVLYKKLPKNEGSVGVGTLGAHPTTEITGDEVKPKRGRKPHTRAGIRRQAASQKASKLLKKVRALENPDFVAVDNFGEHVRKKTEKDLIEASLRGEHPLAFSAMERFQIRALSDTGVEKHQLAKRFGTSLGVISRILSMKETLPKAREEAISQQFFAFSKLLNEVMAGMTPEKIKGASMSQLILAAGISFDKVLGARKALDGDAPDKHQYEIVHGTYADRQTLIAEVRDKISRMQDEGLLPAQVIPVEGEVVESQERALEASSPTATPPPQLEMFENPES